MFRSRFQLPLIALALLAPVASARAVFPQQTGGGSGGRVSTVRTRCANCGTARDSVLRRKLEQLVLKSDSLRWQIENVHLSPGERERIAVELNNNVLATKATLDEMMSDVTVTRVQPGAVIARSAQGQSAVSAVAGARVAPGTLTMVYESWKPRGYLGVTFDGQPADEIFRDGQQYIRFYQYPKIALVEPSSPAERAGVLVGDTLLELNGTDVRKEISLTRLLVPDTRITVRVRRDGDTRDLPVVVRESPEYYARRAIPLPRSAPQPSRVEVMMPAPPSAQTAPTPATPRAMTGWLFTEGVAGARLETINQGMGKALGVREGVFVLGVRPGPAHSAGLREGDVILKAGGRTVPNVGALRDILNGSDGEDGVKLVIRREGREQTLVMHW
jgi:S1-C subfamily serine protease